MIEWLGPRLRIAMSLMIAMSCPVLAADEVEFISGAKLTGKVANIRVADKEFDFEAQVGGRNISKTYRFDEVHAVTIGSKRHVLTQKPATPANISGRPERTRAQVRAMIDRASQDPDWLANTSIDAPPSLDLSWPQKAEGAWNNQKNVGQYIWDIINPNPNRWRAGIKLVQQIAETHQSDPALRQRDFQVLGRMYFELLRDYARAAYWLEMGDARDNLGLGVKLAECYWQLGSGDMAMELLAKKSLPLSAIKLLGEMGDVDRALRLAAAFYGTNGENDARILAADLLRGEGRLDEAIEMYQKVVQSTTFRNADYEKRTKGRAQDSLDAIQIFDKADVTQVADGRYRESSRGYNGSLEVEVTVVGGRIENVAVLRHQEKQFYSALEDTPQQIVARQSVRDIDGFSGATITSVAIVNATAKALAQGSQP